jgi:DNA-binding NtrC family response regulator
VFAEGGELDRVHFEQGAQMRFDLDATRADESTHLDALDERYVGLDNEIAQIETRRIGQAMDQTAGNQSAAARLLKLGERVLRYKLKKYFPEQ